MNLIESTFKDLTERKQRIASGKLNAIPTNLARFSNEFPGIEKSRYYIITANTKVGKSQVTDFYFVIDPIYQLWLNKLTSYDVRVHYISLEMHPIEKMYQLFSHYIYRTQDKIRVDPKILKSTKSELSDKWFNYLESNIDFFKFFLSKVSFINNLRTVSQIESYIKAYYAQNGSVINEGSLYLANNNDIYEIFIVDHASLIDTETKYPNKHTAIKALSKLFLDIRNLYRSTCVLIQQQSSASENIEAQKVRKGEPSLDMLEYNKSTGFDADYVLGLYSPARNNIQSYRGYDIAKFKDHFRTIKILAGRWGGIGSWTPLFFDGAVNMFKELPLIGSQDMIKVNELLTKLKK